MKVTDVRPQKNKAGRDSVYIDGRYAFGLDRATTQKLGLVHGVELDPEQVERIQGEVNRQRAMDAALRLLSYRGRSVREISERLRRRGFSPELVEQTSRRLAELGLLDDQRFAESVARDRLEFARKGNRLISAELRRKGVPRPLIERALEQAGDEADSARALLAKVGRRYSGLSARARYRKLHDLLLRRGFSFQTISRILAEEERRAADEDEEEP